MKNLFICLTPLQCVIAQKLIERTPDIPADLLMICYSEANNTKFNYYYRETAKLCEFSKVEIVPKNKWLREFHLFETIKGLDKGYETIYVASIDNPNIQFPLSHINFNKLETFDDGVGNIYPTSILYLNKQYGIRARLLRKLQGIRYNTQDLRQLSSLHHTLYPKLDNIAQPTQELQLWDSQFIPAKDNKVIKKILLGQPVFDSDNENRLLFNKIIEHVRPDAYFPHPRETHRLAINYINTPLIFEDYLLQSIHENPDTQYHIYHTLSTAALNVANFPNTYIHTLRPTHTHFENAAFVYLYSIVEKMNLPIETVEIT